MFLLQFQETLSLVQIKQHKRVSHASEGMNMLGTGNPAATQGQILLHTCTFGEKLLQINRSNFGLKTATIPIANSPCKEVIIIRKQQQSLQDNIHVNFTFSEMARR